MNWFRKLLCLLFHAPRSMQVEVQNQDAIFNSQGFGNICGPSTPPTASRSGPNAVTTGAVSGCDNFLGGPESQSIGGDFDDHFFIPTSEIVANEPFVFRARGTATGRLFLRPRQLFTPPFGSSPSATGFAFSQISVREMDGGNGTQIARSAQFFHVTTTLNASATPPTGVSLNVTSSVDMELEFTPSGNANLQVTVENQVAVLASGRLSTATISGPNGTGPFIMSVSNTTVQKVLDEPCESILELV